MTTAEALVAGKIEEVRAEYEARGFDVVVDPGPEQVPFDFDGFQPDLLARSDGANYLVVVRISGMWASLERLMDLSDEVQRHAGWHLVLVTADDVELAGAPGLDDALPSWPRLRAEAARALGMGHTGSDPDAAFFVLWATVEGVLRKTAECEGLPVERLPTADVLPSLYSFGALSLEQHDRLRAALALRNRVGHGFGAGRAELEAAVNDLMAVLAELLPRATERAA